MTNEMPSVENLQERALSDAELIQGGAKFKENESGASLDITGEQVENARREMEEAKRVEAILTPEQSKKRMGEYLDALKAGYDEGREDESSKVDKFVYNAIKEALLNTDRKEFVSYPGKQPPGNNVDKNNEWRKSLNEAQAEWRDLARGLFAGAKKSGHEEDIKFQRLGFYLSLITEANNPDQIKASMLKDTSLTRNFVGGEERLEELLNKK